jgi:hypothetical protein
LNAGVVLGLLVAAAVVVLACSGGCALGLLGLVQAPEEIPPELGAILDDSATFLVDPNEPLEPIAGGTAVSDVAELDGCWGSAWQLPSSVPGQTMGVYQALKFDAAAGQLERLTYQSLVVVAPIVMVERGTFSLDAEGVGTFEVTQELSTVRTGELTDDTDRFTTLPVYEVRLAWDGQELLAHFSETDTPRTSGGFADRVSLRHRPFTCP